MTKVNHKRHECFGKVKVSGGYFGAAQIAAERKRKTMTATDLMDVIDQLDNREEQLVLYRALARHMVALVTEKAEREREDRARVVEGKPAPRRVVCPACRRWLPVVLYDSSVWCEECKIWVGWHGLGYRPGPDDGLPPGLGD